jgi:hypothetical protein
MRDRRWRPAPALFALVLGVYAYFYQAGGWNQNARFDLVRAIVEQGTLRIDAYEGNTGDKAERDGHFYSDKAPGVSLMAVPVYAVVHALAGQLRETDRFQAWASYLCTLWAVSLPSAVAVVMLYLVCGVLGLAPPVAAAVTLAYAFGTLAFPYSTLLYGHQPAAAFAFIAFVLLVQARHADPGSPVGRGRLCAAGLALGGAVVIEYPALLSMAVVAVYALACVRPRGRLAWMALGAALALAVLFTYHALAFGGPLTLPYQFSIQQPRHRGFFMGLGLPSARALYYILFDEYRGLFYGSPWLLLSVPGSWLLLRHRRFRAEGAVCVTVALLYVALNASLSDWHGGWGMGPRHLVPALPFLALAVAGIEAGAWTAASGGVATIRADVRAAARVAGGLGIAFSMLLMLAGAAVKPEVPRDVYRPYQQFLLPAFFEGRLALNTQSIDMVTGRGRVQRFAWNLGQRLGLEGGASLLPLALYAALAGGWLLVALHRESGGPR